VSPKRIQLSRSRGWKKPPGAVVVSRPSRWGNPFTVVEHGRAGAVAAYRQYLRDNPALVTAAREELAGRDLACWCPLADDEGRPVPCHAEILLEVAAGGRP